MFTIDFYETANGQSDVRDFMEELRQKRESNKDVRIQFKQITMYIELLAQNGTQLPDNITKHIDDGIWELRPWNNVCFTSTFMTIASFFCIISERNRRKRLNERLIVRKQNVLTI